MPSMIRGDWVDCAFSSGALQVGEDAVKFAVHRLGEVLLPSGRVASSDPLVYPDPEPYTLSVPPGRYPVEVAVASLNGEDERVAFARVLFSPEAVDRWVLAVTAGQDPATLSENEVFGYAVDTATGCFLAPETGELLSRRMDQESEYFQTIIDQMEETGRDTWSWAVFQPDPGSDYNVVAFSTGYGDGFYASYFGLAADGRPVTLVTDFEVLMEPAPAGLQAPGPSTAKDPSQPSSWEKLAGFIKALRK